MELKGFFNFFTRWQFRKTTFRVRCQTNHSGSNLFKRKQGLSKKNHIFQNWENNLGRNNVVKTDF